MSNQNTSNKKHDFPERNPYELLGVSIDASDAEISKAYRKLALKLHPDKQQQSQQQASSPKQQKRVEEEFHGVQQARAFLLDAEYAETRRAYRAKLLSRRVREQADAVRERELTASRKRMRDELHRQEQRYAANAAANESSQEIGSKRSRSKKTKAEKDEEYFEKLKRDGKRMREEYAQKEIDEEIVAKERELAKRLLERRQVKLKWSRKKIRNIFHDGISERSIRELFQTKFGSGHDNGPGADVNDADAAVVVERVEMTGKKGNTAIVTFTDRRYVPMCVNAYATTDEIRASSIVGDNSQKEEGDEQDRASSRPSARTSTAAASGGRLDHRDAENLEDWKMRQAAERETLLRQMEAEEEGEATGEGKDTEDTRGRHGGDADDGKMRKPKGKSSSSASSTFTMMYPPKFPNTPEYNRLSIPLAKLEMAERELLFFVSSSSSSSCSPSGLVDDKNKDRNAVISREVFQRMKLLSS